MFGSTTLSQRKKGDLLTQIKDQQVIQKNPSLPVWHLLLSKKNLIGILDTGGNPNSTQMRVCTLWTNRKFTGLFIKHVLLMYSLLQSASSLTTSYYQVRGSCCKLPSGFFQLHVEQGPWTEVEKTKCGNLQSVSEIALSWSPMWLNILHCITWFQHWLIPDNHSLEENHSDS